MAVEKWHHAPVHVPYKPHFQYFKILLNKKHQTAFIQMNKSPAFSHVGENVWPWEHAAFMLQAWTLPGDFQCNAEQSWTWFTI